MRRGGQVKLGRGRRGGRVELRQGAGRRPDGRTDAVREAFLGPVAYRPRRLSTILAVPTSSEPRLQRLSRLRFDRRVLCHTSGGFMATGDCRLIPMVASYLGLSPVSAQWRGIDAVLPILERMRSDGAIVLIKLDGGRGPSDGGPYTVLASGGPLKGDFVRADVSSIEHGIAKVIVEYARRCWGFVEPS